MRHRLGRAEAPLQVAILGCGPSGLAAAHAIKAVCPGDSSIIRIFSKRRKSHLYGAQYLHAPIPGLHEDVDSAQVTYLLQGTAEDYRRKVYGENYGGSVSPEDLPVNHMAWDIRSTYHQLWLMYERLVVDTGALDPRSLRSVLGSTNYDLVVNTIPLNTICRRPSQHKFLSQEIWAMGDAPEADTLGPVRLPQDNMVVCNGSEFPEWYRTSRIFNYSTIEWPLDTGEKWLPHGAVKVKKPLASTCDCWNWEQDGFIHVGRYGAWAKGFLVHHAYIHVFNVVAEMERLGWYHTDPNNEIGLLAKLDS